ncbi:MAG: PQQ-binding-like beta-propeller repeat protein [Planctomycetota bacterium]
MKSTFCFCCASVFIAGLSASPLFADDASEVGYVWPQWRGAHQNGVAGSSDIASAKSWNVDDPVWAVDIPGLGGSTPVVASGRAFLTSGVDGNNTLRALDVNTGTTVWTMELGGDRGNKHRKGSGSNPSAVTDGEYVAAYYRSGDLASLTVDGSLAWRINLQEEFGEDTLWWDLGSSPALIDGMVVVAVMQTGPSYLVAYDLATGQLRWKVDRMLDAPKEAAQSYTTPIGVTVNGESMIAVMGADHLTLHRAVDGQELGRVDGFNPDGEEYFRSISSPVASDSSHGPPMAICPYARGSTLTAVNLELLAAGKTDAAVIWSRDDLGSDVPTPAIYDDVVVLVSDGKRDKGSVYGLSLYSGETLWKTQLPRTRNSYSSSPLLMGSTAVVIGEDARISLVGPLDATPAVIRTMEMSDRDPFTVASPVPLPGGDLLIRTRHQLTRLTASN